MRGFDAKAIARWDVVPFQTIDDNRFHIGVVAFHINGIDHVEFSANGGPWISSHEMQLNPRTNVWEYTVILNASLFEDGPVELRAIAWPKEAGLPRVLAGEINSDSITNGNHSMFIAANANGTLPTMTCYVSSETGDDDTGDGSEENPYESIMKAVKGVSNASPEKTADGGIIYLMAGEHAWGPYQYANLSKNSWRWLTIRPAPGLTKADVTINDSSSFNWWDGIRLSLQKIEDVTLEHPASISTTAGNAGIWLHNVVFNGPGGGTNGDIYTQYHAVNHTQFASRGIYLTDSLYNEMLRPSINYTLTRNVRFQNIGLDGWFNPRMILNSEISQLGVFGDVGHRDVLQFYQGNDNTIVFGFKAIDEVIAQPIFSRGQFGSHLMDNTAFVNVLINRNTLGDTDVSLSQWKQSANHLLLWHVALLDRTLLFANDGSAHTPELTNVSIQGSVFQKIVYLMTEQEIDTLQIANNHFIDVDSYGAVAPGTDVTTGPPVFTDVSDDDYRPNVNSPLLNRLPFQLVPIDLEQERRRLPATLGPLEYPPSQ